MNLLLRDPFRELDSLHDRLTEIFEKNTAQNSDQALLPINVYEEEGALNIDAVVPHFTPDEVEVNVTKDHIEIRAEHTEETETKERKYYHREASAQRLYRRVALPNNVDTEKAKAVQKNGVLSISIPLEETKQSRKLEIESGDKT